MFTTILSYSLLFLINQRLISQPVMPVNIAPLPAYQNQFEIPSNILLPPDNNVQIVDLPPSTLDSSSSDVSITKNDNSNHDFPASIQSTPSHRQPIVYAIPIENERKTSAVRNDQEILALLSKYLSSDSAQDKRVLAEEIGVKSGLLAIQEDMPDFIKVYPGKYKGEPDLLIWCCPDTQNNFLGFIEFKGMGGRLGTRRINNTNYQQLTPEYRADIGHNLYRLHKQGKIKFNLSKTPFKNDGEVITNIINNKTILPILYHTRLQKFSLITTRQIFQGGSTKFTFFPERLKKTPPPLNRSNKGHPVSSGPPPVLDTVRFNSSSTDDPSDYSITDENAVLMPAMRKRIIRYQYYHSLPFAPVLINKYYTNNIGFQIYRPMIIRGVGIR